MLCQDRETAGNYNWDVTLAAIRNQNLVSMYIEQNKYTDNSHHFEQSTQGFTLQCGVSTVLECGR